MREDVFSRESCKSRTALGSGVLRIREPGIKVISYCERVTNTANNKITYALEALRATLCVAMYSMTQIKTAA